MPDCSPRAALCALVLLITPAAAAQPAEGYDLDAYVAAVEAERAETDSTFRDPAATVLDVRSRAHFDGLDYYPVDPAFRLAAEVERVEGAAPFALPTTGSAGGSQYRPVARLHFTLDGGRHTLTAYETVDVEWDSLFVPFRDATSGRATYGGGRFLSVPLPEPGASTADLDFNKAYNPSCAYSPAYSCPIPPPENHLAVAVEAGVKKPPPPLLDALSEPWPSVWTTSEHDALGLRVDFPYAVELVEADAEGGPRQVSGTLTLGTAGLVVAAVEVPDLGGASPAQRQRFLSGMKDRFAQTGALERTWTDELPAGEALAVRVVVEGRTHEHRVLLAGRWLVDLIAVDVADEAARARFFESLRLGDA